MKLFHLADLHLGKRLNEYSLIEDQRHILDQVLALADAEHPDAIVVAGDVYDKAMPSAEAVSLFDDFLWGVAQRGLACLVVSGNHDSPERLSFGSRLMGGSRIHMSRCYRPDERPVTFEDEHGTVCFHLLPFVKPIHVRRALEERYPDEAEAIGDYTDAVRAAIAHMGVDESRRNVLVAHQFVAGSVRSDSEEVHVGGLDNVDPHVFDPFDYVALGHLHAPQRVLRDTVRYSGTPLKYSFSEAAHRKSVTVVELGRKGEVAVDTLPLVPLHDLREIRGTYDELVLRRNWEGTNVEDFIGVTLTDEDDVPYAIEKLRLIYPNIMQLAYDNTRTRTNQALETVEHVEELTPMELFSRFFESQNNQPMSERQREVVAAAIESVWEVAS